MKPHWQGTGESNPLKLNVYELKELRIIKQAVLKSLIEAVGYNASRTEETEKFLEDWIRWIFRETEKDFKLVKEQEEPF